MIVTFDVESTTVQKGNPSDLFDYCDGKLYWKRDGKLAGRCGTRGYWQVKINGKMYLVHHLIWWIFHGHKPEYIDHINGDPSDNRIENLRECTLTQNQYNAKLSKANKSGYKNVFWNKQREKWTVKIGQIRYGYFDELNEAVTAAEEARANHCREFRRTE